MEWQSAGLVDETCPGKPPIVAATDLRLRSAQNDGLATDPRCAPSYLASFAKIMQKYSPCRFHRTVGSFLDKGRVLVKPFIKLFTNHSRIGRLLLSSISCRMPA